MPILLPGMTKELQIRGQGYGFIVDESGLIIAHPDEDRKGQKLEETEEQKQFILRTVRTLLKGLQV